MYTEKDLKVGEEKNNGFRQYRQRKQWKLYLRWK